MQDPKQQIDLAIKQLEGLLADSLNSAAEVAGEAGLLHQKANWEQRQRDDFARKAALAVQKAKEEHAKGDEQEAAEWEDAAREAIQTKLLHQDLAAQYEEQADALDAQVVRLRGELGKLRLLIQKLRVRKEVVVAKEAQTAALRKIGQVAIGAVDLDDVLTTMERMEDKATVRLETAKARVELARDPVAEKLDKLTYDARVEAEMAKLKGGA
jgi:phage shock protein A